MRQPDGVTRDIQRFDRQLKTKRKASTRRFRFCEFDGRTKRLRKIDSLHLQRELAGCNARGVKKIVDTVQQKIPTTKILLLAVFPRGMNANDPVRAKLKQVNDAISQLDGVSARLTTAELVRLNRSVEVDGLSPARAAARWWADG